jgi:hypothetical protein
MTLTLQKGQHTHIIRYDEGDEGAVLENLVEQVNTGKIDWFDAATLSHQLGQLLSKTTVTKKSK